MSAGLPADDRPTPEALELRVAKTWDGEPIPEDEQVVFTISAAGAALGIHVDAPFHDDPPPPGGLGPADGLWDYEVAELFIAGGDGGGETTNTELAPHGHHLLLRLHGIRQVVSKLEPLAYSARIAGGRWHGEALLPGRLLPPPPHRANAYPIHGVGRARRYLAMMPVPGRAPDFHRLDVFEALELPVDVAGG